MAGGADSERPFTLRQKKSTGEWFLFGEFTGLLAGIRIPEAERGSCSGYSVSWKTQERSTFDRAKFEADHGPIPKQYFKVSTSRPFKLFIKE